MKNKNAVINSHCQRSAFKGVATFYYEMIIKNNTNWDYFGGNKQLLSE